MRGSWFAPLCSALHPVPLWKGRSRLTSERSNIMVCLIQEIVTRFNLACNLIVTSEVKRLPNSERP